jgi:hypothetical protein
MSHEPSYVITPAERQTLLEGPLGAVLLLASRFRSQAPITHVAGRDAVVVAC